MEEWMDGWVDGWMDGWKDGWMNGQMSIWMNGGMDGWVGGWIDGWVGGWMDGWMEKRQNDMRVKVLNKDSQHPHWNPDLLWAYICLWLHLSVYETNDLHESGETTGHVMDQRTAPQAPVMVAFELSRPGASQSIFQQKRQTSSLLGEISWHQLLEMNLITFKTICSPNKFHLWNMFVPLATSSWDVEQTVMSQCLFSGRRGPGVYVLYHNITFNLPPILGVATIIIPTWQMRGQRLRVAKK